MEYENLVRNHEEFLKEMEIIIVIIINGI